MIREALLNDLDGLLELEQLSFEHDRFHRRQLRYLITKAQGKVLVYDKDGLILGALIILWRRNNFSARIVSVAVRPESRSQGIGAALVKKVDNIARAKGLTKISLEVRMDNEKAISFYESQGYIRTGLQPDYYIDGMTGVRYQKLL